MTETDGMETGTTSHEAPFTQEPENPTERLYDLGNLDDELEEKEMYQPGGFHPVHLGDTLGNNGRYKVIHKLGYGGFATVWLCRDIEMLRYVALKIIIADASENSPELKVLSKNLDSTQTGGDKIVIPENHFWIDGPNGSHLCLVLPVMGPDVSSIFFRPVDIGKLSRSIAFQAVQGIAFLHSNGICHGDFRPKNILLELSNFGDLSEEQLIEELGEPSLDPVLTAPGELPGPNAPKYLVRGIDFDEIDSRYVTDQIRIIDFGESYEPSNPPEDLGIPMGYLPPETIIDNTIGIASDLWALACTLFEVRSGNTLFEMCLATKYDIVQQIVKLLGTLPGSWRESWEKQCGKSCNDGEPNDTPTDEDPFEKGKILKEYLGEGYGFWVVKTGQKIDHRIPEDEIEVLADLLEQMLRYDPNDRISAESVLDHPWFNWKSTEDQKDQENMSEHETGQQDGGTSHDDPEDKKEEETTEAPLEGNESHKLKARKFPGDKNDGEVKGQPGSNVGSEVSGEQPSDGGGTGEKSVSQQEEVADKNEELFRRNLARLLDETRERKQKRRRSI